MPKVRTERSDGNSIVLRFPQWSIAHTVEAAYAQLYYYLGHTEWRNHAWRRWMQREATITTQIAGTLSAFPQDWLGGAFRRLLQGCEMPDRLRVVTYTIKPNFLEPDILLSGAGRLLMVEGKTGTRGTASHRFPASQLLNYGLLQVYRERATQRALPSCFSLLILAPGKWQEWLENGEQWIRAVDDRTGRVHLDLDVCMRLGADKSRRLREREALRRLLPSMTVCYRTWRDLVDAFAQEYSVHSTDPYRQHWHRLVAELRLLSRLARSGRGIENHA